MLPIRSWRIFYADGSAFDSTMGSWAEAPPFGVQCVVYYEDPPEPPRSRIVAGQDVYEYEAAQPITETQVKLGLYMDEEGFYRIQDMASRSTAPHVTEEPGG